MDDDDLEKRLIELEIKASLADDLLDELNQVIFRQQRQIEWLLHEVASLRDQHRPESSDTPTRNPRDDIPPHY